jgi:hypothetical protein
MGIINKIIVFLLVVILLSFAYTTFIFAHDLCNFYSPDDASWTFLFEPSHIHMGDKYTSYDYIDIIVEDNYKANFDDGKGLWGTYINMWCVPYINMGWIDSTYDWTDESDTICNDCGYMRPIAIVEVGGLLTVTLDGQSWVLNISGTGELQYNSSYSLPNGGTLIWNDVGDGNPYHRYCYNYNGIDYFYGDQYTSYTTQFADLREMTKVKRDEYSYYKLRYIRERPDQRYQFQWVQTTNNLIGGFYAQLFGNEVNGYYVKIYRVLLDGSGNKYHYAEVWSPSMKITVYFSP